MSVVNQFKHKSMKQEMGWWDWLDVGPVDDVVPRCVVMLDAAPIDDVVPRCDVMFDAARCFYLVFVLVFCPRVSEPLAAAHDVAVTRFFAVGGLQRQEQHGVDELS